MSLPVELMTFVRDVTGGMTDEVVADHVGVSLNTWRAFKAGRYVSDETLTKFAAAFPGVELAQMRKLAGRSEDRDALLRQVQTLVGALGLPVSKRIEVMNLIRAEIGAAAETPVSNAA